MLSGLKKGQRLSLTGLEIREGETSPPRRYTSGSMILAMENAGQLIEDEELRSQIKGSGIGTSATRAEILKKLCTIKYLSLAKKTQVITPTLLGEMVFDVCSASIRQRGKGPHLCGRGYHHPGGIYGKAGAVRHLKDQRCPPDRQPVSAAAVFRRRGPVL